MLSTRKALLGEVIPSLRGVAVNWNGNCIVVYYYHDGDINDIIRDHYSCINTEIIAGFHTNQIDENFQGDFMKKILHSTPLTNTHYPSLPFDA